MLLWLLLLRVLWVLWVRLEMVLLWLLLVLLLGRWWLLVLRHLGTEVEGRWAFTRLDRHSRRAYVCCRVVVWLHEHVRLLLFWDMGVVHRHAVGLGKRQVHGHVVLVHELLAVLLDLCPAVLEPVLQLG